VRLLELLRVRAEVLRQREEAVLGLGGQQGVEEPAVEVAQHRQHAALAAGADGELSAVAAVLRQLQCGEVVDACFAPVQRADYGEALPLREENGVE
jgi:hypothetical protein